MLEDLPLSKQTWSVRILKGF